MTRPVGDVRRKLECEASDARWRAYQLRKELAGLHESHQRLRRLPNRHERQVRLPWVTERIPAVARELAAAEARAARLEDELEGRQ